jgi:hypothetical protein
MIATNIDRVLVVSRVSGKNIVNGDLPVECAFDSFYSIKSQLQYTGNELTLVSFISMTDCSNRFGAIYPV